MNALLEPACRTRPFRGLVRASVALLCFVAGCTRAATGTGLGDPADAFERERASTTASQAEPDDEVGNWENFAGGGITCMGQERDHTFIVSISDPAIPVGTDRPQRFVVTSMMKLGLPRTCSSVWVVPECNQMQGCSSEGLSLSVRPRKGLDWGRVATVDDLDVAVSTSP